MRARSQSYSDYGPATTAANMKQVSTLTIILVIYISSLQGTASVYRSVGGGLGDDYEIVIPPHILANMSWTNLGPQYDIDKPVELEILGPRTYNIREGKELALICRDKNNRNNNMIAWRRKEGRMPNGERQVVGGQVIIERVGREDGGEYQCWDLRDNTTNIIKYVNVLYAPLVTVDKLYLSQQGGLTLELVCSAQANPPASLTWSRLEPTTGQWKEVAKETGQESGQETGVWSVNRQVGRAGGLSVVVINNPRGRDHLGHYLCTANSTLGTSSNTLHLRGFNEEIQDPQEVSMSGQTRYKLDLVLTLLYFTLLSKYFSK